MASINNFNGKWIVIITFLLPFFISCRTIRIYPNLNKSISRDYHVGYFPPFLAETSGLEMMGDSMISFNDSGGEAGIYIFPPDAPEAAVFIDIPGVKNIDWEDVTVDSSFIYIADIGNNYGNRDTLLIYRIDIRKLFKGITKPEVISFSYKEKTADKMKNRKNSFDCEALTIIRDTLWLFTKNWHDESSWIYKMPAVPGHYDLQVQSALFPQMLVTGADYTSDKNLLILIGYHNFRPRIRGYILEDNSIKDFFLIRFDNLPGVQTEGIVIKENEVYFSNEKSLKQQGLYKIKLE